MVTVEWLQLPILWRRSQRSIYCERVVMRWMRRSLPLQFYVLSNLKRPALAATALCSMRLRTKAAWFALNGSGKAPGKANLSWFVDQGMKQISLQSPHSVTVPGAIDAWCKLHDDYGRKTFSELLAPAIRLAIEGYTVHPRVAYDWAQLAKKTEGYRKCDTNAAGLMARLRRRAIATGNPS